MSSFRRNSVLVRLTLANSYLSTYSYDSNLKSNDSGNDENATIQITKDSTTTSPTPTNDDDDDDDDTGHVFVCEFEIIFGSFEGFFLFLGW